MKERFCALTAALLGTVCVALCLFLPGAAACAAGAAAVACLGWLGWALYALCCDIERLMREPSDPPPALRHPQARRLQKALAQRADLQKEEYSAHIMDSQFRINTLQNQINPHFLYNTLECIRSEALMQGCDNIARMSRALAAFFRYSISRKENIVTLQDEIDNIRNYFLIQQFRFDDRFLLDVRITEADLEALDCLVPKMIVQPVVENCIFHGLEPKAGPGRVTLRIDCTEDKLLLTISDNGVGMEAEILERMRARLHDPAADGQQGRGNGIAMYNVNQRIRLTYGEEYGVSVYSTPGVGTDVEMVLPRITEREKMPVCPA